MAKNYYSILHLDRSAPVEEIKRAYRALARKYHPDVNSADPSAAHRFHEITIAYETLCDPQARLRYDVNLRGDRSDLPTPSQLKLEVLLSNPIVAIKPERQVIYLLTQLSVNKTLPAMAMPLNLCLVLDRSSSMRGEKLKAMKDAIISVIDRMNREDYFSLVVFDDRADVMIPAQHIEETTAAKATVQRIQQRGGTEMARGLEAGLNEVLRYRSPGYINHILLLTDGRTYGDEAKCKDLAALAGEKRIGISAMGIGTEWNSHLLDTIASKSGGDSDFIQTPRRIGEVFRQRIANLRSVIACNTIMTIATEPGTTVKRVTRVVPDISDLEPVVENGYELHVNLGGVRLDQGQALLWEILLNPQPKGSHLFARLDLRFDMPSKKLYDQCQSDDLWIEFITGRTPEVNPVVKQVLEELVAYRLQERARELASTGQYQMATQQLRMAANRLLSSGHTDMAASIQAQVSRMDGKSQTVTEDLLKLKYGTKNLALNGPPGARASYLPAQYSNETE